MGFDIKSELKVSSSTTTNTISKSVNTYGIDSAAADSQGLKFHTNKTLTITSLKCDSRGNTNRFFIGSSIKGTQYGSGSLTAHASGAISIAIPNNTDFYIVGDSSTGTQQFYYNNGEANPQNFTDMNMIGGVENGVYLGTTWRDFVEIKTSTTTTTINVPTKVFMGYGGLKCV